MATDREKLDWLIDALELDEEWLDHAVTCDDCTLDLGWEYGGRDACLQYGLDHNEVRYGPHPRPPQWVGEMGAVMLKQIMNAPTPQGLTDAITSLRPGETVFIPYIRDEPTEPPGGP